MVPKISKFGKFNDLYDTPPIGSGHNLSCGAIDNWPLKRNGVRIVAHSSTPFKEKVEPSSSKTFGGTRSQNELNTSFTPKGRIVPIGRL